MITLRLFAGCIQQIAPYAFLCMYPFRGHLRFSPRKTFLMTAALILGCGILFSLSGTALAAALPDSPALWQSVNGIFLCCLFFCFCWYLYAVNAIWQKKLFVFSFMVTCGLTLTSVYNYISDFNTEQGALPYSGFFHLYYLIAEVVTIPLFWLFLKIFYMPIEEGLGANESGYLSVLSLFLSGLFSFGTSLVSYDLLSSDPSSLFLLLSLMVSIFVIYLLFFRMYFLSYEKIRSQREALQLQYQTELFGEQYRRILENMESNRKMRHDLIHHLLVVRGFLEECSPEKAREYLDQYMESSRKYEFRSFCGNPMVNMLVSHYDALAKEHGLDFSVRIRIPDALSIQDIDLSVLLGNLLENAVKAAGHAPEAWRYIRLNMICSGKMLAVTVDNGFDGNVKWDGAHYLSTKQGHHGMGLKSLEDLSIKYNGGVEFSHKGMEFHAAVMVGLK